MYEAFFSLEDAPFVLTPDPRFLLRSKGHHEILSTLIYGITSQKGLMALIGDVGTGKTMLCRALLRELPKDVGSALVLNPFLSDAELLGTILDDLGVEVLDEAQQMSVEALEQIRILSTLETATRKLLQIVLVGQPELEEKLQRHELRQLDQRIGIRCYLKPLSRKETFRYVEHRLRIAGLAGALPFAHGALVRIYRYSRGIPRVINLVCDRALTAAFGARAREVPPALVKAAIRNLEGERPRRRRGAVSLSRPSTAWKLGRVAAGVAGVLLAASGDDSRGAARDGPSRASGAGRPIGPGSVSAVTAGRFRGDPGLPRGRRDASGRGRTRHVVDALRMGDVAERGPPADKPEPGVDPDRHRDAGPAPPEAGAPQRPGADEQYRALPAGGAALPVVDGARA